MPSFGRYGGFPLKFGGGKSALQVTHEFLLGYWSKALDVSEESLTFAETYAEAVVLSNIDAANKRFAHQGQPSRMIDMLPVWETILHLAPLSTDTDVQRRRNVAGKVRAFVGNAIPDIRDASRKLLGPNFVRVFQTTSANDITYWPGIYPGPPGLEWSSNRATIGIEVTQSGLSAAEFRRLMASLSTMLDSMLPSWMTFEWFVVDSDSTGDEGFVLGQSLLGVHAL